MATKKAAVKKSAAKPVKSGKSAAKTPAKKAAAPANAKSASKAAPKKAPAKPAPKAAKASPAKKTAPAKAVKAAPKKAAPAKKAAAPAKAVKAAPKKVAPAASKKVVTTPVKAAPKAAVKTLPAAKKAAEPVKKPVAETKKQEEKPVIKPAASKPAPAKAAPAKPIVIPKTSTTKSVKYEPEFTKSVLDTSQQQQQGPSMRYSDADLSEFRELINRKLDTAKKELAYLQGLITRKDEGGDLDEGRYMTMEDGSMSMEREQLSQMASRQIQFIDHLEKAIMRIENKTYGICRVTGKLIDKARLRAVPHATLSIEAKQMMNK